jgi:FkbM family methyltransferase
MLESWIKMALQKILGFENYLFIFSRFTIKRLEYGQIEKEFLQFMKLVPNEGIILDLGANIGIMTAHMASRRPGAKIWSFEPIPQNIKALKRIVTHFNLSNVQVFELALGEENGEVKMVMPVIDGVKMQGLSHVIHDTIQENNDGMYFSVPVKKLDDLPELQDKVISAIKIDVENFEYFVLNGAKKLLATHKPVIYCELWDNENRTKTFSLLKEIGYQIMVAENNQLVPFQQQNIQNFIFVHKN